MGEPSVSSGFLVSLCQSQSQKHVSPCQETSSISLGQKKITSHSLGMDTLSIKPRPLPFHPFGHPAMLFVTVKENRCWDFLSTTLSKWVMISFEKCDLGCLAVALGTLLIGSVWGILPPVLKKTHCWGALFAISAFSVSKWPQNIADSSFTSRWLGWLANFMAASGLKGRLLSPLYFKI